MWNLTFRCIASNLKITSVDIFTIDSCSQLLNDGYISVAEFLLKASRLHRYGNILPSSELFNIVFAEECEPEVSNAKFQLILYLYTFILFMQCLFGKKIHFIEYRFEQSGLQGAFIFCVFSFDINSCHYYYIVTGMQ